MEGTNEPGSDRHVVKHAADCIRPGRHSEMSQIGSTRPARAQAGLGLTDGRLPSVSPHSNLERGFFVINKIKADFNRPQIMKVAYHLHLATPIQTLILNIL